MTIAEIGFPASSFFSDHTHLPIGSITAVGPVRRLYPTRLAWYPTQHGHTARHPTHTCRACLMAPVETTRQSGRPTRDKSRESRAK
jgi:hypothetical protein